MKNLIFINGKSDQGEGLFVNNAKVKIDNCTFVNNYASRGGAIYNSGTLEINNSNFISNFATVYGGAIKNWGPCVINNSRFSDNYCKDTGGAIFNLEKFIFILQVVFLQTTKQILLVELYIM